MSVFNLCGLIAKVNPSDFAAHADLTVLSFELVPKRFPHWYVCAPFVYKYQVHTYTHAYTGMPRLFPDASLVRASARESRSATQVAPLEISDS